MAWAPMAFVGALGVGTVLRLWLAGRQREAVRLHREHVPAAFRGAIAAEDQRKSADYTLARVGFGRWVVLADTTASGWLVVGGGLAACDSAVTTFLPQLPAGPWHGTVVVLAVAALLFLWGLPFTLWRIFVLEARFGFNRTTARLFAIDLGKQVLLAGALGAPLILAMLAVMRWAGALWWVAAWLLYVTLTLALTWAAPRFIAPLFNRFTALADEALRQRLEALVARCGFRADGGVFVMDGSRRSAHGNAYFTGIGRHKRIVFFDTLLARIESAEVEAVLAHELGHFRLHHVRQRLLVSLGASLAAFALLGWLAAQPALYAAFAVPSADEMALLLFVLASPAFTFFATPIESWWSRRQERAADDFAVRHADARMLVSALVKLYRDNASTLTPDALHSAFYDSHPPAAERIARLQRMAPQGLAPTVSVP